VSGKMAGRGEAGSLIRLEGRIIKGIGGFYTVETAGGLIVCRLRGIFRKEGIKPLAGDLVEITAESQDSGVIEKIFERTSWLPRPPVANIDRLYIVSACDKPKPDSYLIDRLAAAACSRGIEAMIVFNKSDLDTPGDLPAVYRQAGFETFVVSCETGEGAEALKRSLAGHISCLAGNTGVGKSSILNLVFGSDALETGAISEKLGRGKHTTRQVELFKTDGGYVVDTPGFASIDYTDIGGLSRENLAFYFIEFLPYLGRCKYTSCSHTGDDGCAIAQAVEAGDIPVRRYLNYGTIYRHITKNPGVNNNRDSKK